MDDDAGAAGDADPVARGGAEGGGDAGEEVVGEGEEAALVLEGAEGAGVLGEEEIGGGAVALLEDGGGELGGAAVADADVDAGVGFELVKEGADERLAAAGVDGEAKGFVVGAAVVAAAGGEQEGGGEQGEGESEPGCGFEGREGHGVGLLGGDSRGSSWASQRPGGGDRPGRYAP